MGPNVARSRRPALGVAPVVAGALIAALVTASLICWMFGFWIGQVAVTIGAIVAARQLLH